MVCMISPKESLTILLPLALIPLVIFSVLNFGSLAGIAILGITSAYLYLFKADAHTRRLMLVLVIFSQIFETMNVIGNFYNYQGDRGTPLWVSLGWAVLGWYALSVKSVLEKLNDKWTYAVLAVLYGALAVLFNTFTVYVIFGFACVYFAQIASKNFKASYFAFLSVLGILIEYCGTHLGAWTYYTREGLAYFPDYFGLGLAYMMAVLFCMWVVGMDKLKD